MRCTRCQIPLVVTAEDASRWAKHSAYEWPLCGHAHHSFEPV